eukprot:9198558-Alexandrium_andersonii.AAC.1
MQLHLMLIALANPATPTPPVQATFADIIAPTTVAVGCCEAERGGFTACGDEAPRLLSITM